MMANEDGNNNNKNIIGDWARFVNIRTFGMLFFIVACCFCLFKIAELSKNGNSSEQANLYFYETELKLVNAFNRHGDRSPSEDLPAGDKHNKTIDFFWPNGKSSLTESGRQRQFRLGVAMRRRYSSKLDYTIANSSYLLAFSSAVNRCQESMNATLQGLFSLEQSRSEGLRMLDDYNENCFHLDTHHTASKENQPTSCSRHQLATGSGSPEEWRQVAIDVHSVPPLDWNYYYNCSWRENDKERLNADKNLLSIPAVYNLSGVQQLRQELKQNYDLNFTWASTDHWSSILTELRLARTRQTINYTDHFAKWIRKTIKLDEATRSDLEKKFKLNHHHHYKESLEQRLPRLFDVYEAVVLYSARDRIPEGTASKIQVGPLLTSLVDSQQVALMGDKWTKTNGTKDGQQETSTSRQFADRELAEKYKNKTMILYSTHDTILQLLMFRLHLINEDPPGSSYVERFVRGYNLSMKYQYLAGLRMAEFGTSLLFELYEMKQFSRENLVPSPNTNLAESRKPVKSFAFVKSLMYFEEDPTLGPIEFDLLELGSACRRMFRLKYPSISEAEMEKLFYDQDFVSQNEFNPKFSCPFELFRNVTMKDYAINKKELEEFCIKRINTTD